jgi:phosphoserine phosphatase RsbU/P
MSMNSAADSSERKSSLMLRLSLWYLSLTFINVIIFWVGTGSNQMRLISDKASMFARSSAFEAIRRLQAQLDLLSLSRNPIADFGKIKGDFRRQLEVDTTKGVPVLPAYTVFSTGGDVLLSWPETGSMSEVKTEDLITSAKALQLRELKNEPFMAVPDLKRGEITIYLPLTASGNVDLVLAGAIPMPEIRDEITSLVRLGLIMVALLLLLQTGMAYLIYRTLVHPIKRVAAAALRVAAGDFHELEFKPKRHDEVEQLISSFNKMSRDLRDNKETMDFELGIAQKIQEAILPQNLKAIGIEAIVHYNPLYTVSGDFYDMQQLKDGSVAVFIGDASGHGVPAAFITIMAKLFFADLIQKNPDPGVVLHEMNSAMSGYFEGAGLYMTAFYIRIFPDGKAVYCNAMHPEPIVLPRNGDPRLLDSTAFYVGMMKEVFKEYETTEIKLRPGDRIVLYTDGLTEAKNTADDIYSPERFVDLIKSGAAQDSANLVKYALTEVWDFARDAKRTDDETMIIVDFSGKTEGLPEIEITESPGEEVIGENPYYLSVRNDLAREIGKKKSAREIWKFADKCLREKDFITALAGYHVYAESEGQDIPVLFRIALCYYRIRSLGECARILKRCLDLNPETPDTHALFSLLSLKTGDLGKALNHLEKAVAESSGNRYNGILRKINNGLEP